MSFDEGQLIEKAQDLGEGVDASAERVVGAKRDSREGDFATRERKRTSIPSRARRSETSSGYITDL
jgi:hypothetical protein